LNGGDAHIDSTTAVANSLQVRTTLLCRSRRARRTDVAPVRVSPGDEYTVPEAVRDPEERPHQRREDGADDNVQERDEHERACVYISWPPRAWGYIDIPSAAIFEEVKAGTIFENKRHGMVIFWARCSA
jgi:hypothetical protein